MFLWLGNNQVSNRGILQGKPMVISKTVVHPILISEVGERSCSMEIEFSLTESRQSLRDWLNLNALLW